MKFSLLLNIIICFITIGCQKEPNVTSKKVLFGGGCFWTLDYYFNTTEGVIESRCVYTDTGSEAVLVTYNPQKTSLHDLCKLFFEIHDPNNDFKEKYRSVIQIENKQDREIAQKMIEKGKYLTKLEALGKVTLPEEFHEDWHLKKNSIPKCARPAKP